MTWLPSYSPPQHYSRIQGFTERTRGGVAKGILTQQSQTFTGVSHYLPNVCFCKRLQEHSIPSLSALTHPGQLSQIRKISITREQAFFRVGGGVIALPSEFQPLNPPLCKQSSPKRSRGHASVLSLPSSNSCQLKKEDSLVGEVPQQ